MKNFEYLDPKSHYLDSSCQTLRPIEVIEAQDAYFKEYNACGGRAKYKWGQQVDAQVSECREEVLGMLGLSTKEYFCAFTLNTTYGINLVLSQLKAGDFKNIVTSEIEHNSVFLPSISYAKKNNWSRKVLERDDAGNLIYQVGDLQQAVVVLNTSSNIDGRTLGNVSQLTADTHEQGGIILLDASQSMGHDYELLKGVKFDALFTSAHKMYGTSMGVMIIRKDLLAHMEISFLGGGMVEDTNLNDYSLISNNEELSSLLEPGLQNYSGIIALNAAIKWRKTFQPEGQSQQEHSKKLSQMVFDSFKNNKDIVMLNQKPTDVFSIYTEKVDSHRLALFMSEQGLMARSGYFCCHYYLKNLKKYPPLLRVSLGLHNTEAELQEALKIINQLISNS